MRSLLISLVKVFNQFLRLYLTWLWLQKKPKPVKSISPRDAEIYRLHTEEKQTIPSLAEEFGLKEKSVWGICTQVRKRNAAL